MRLAKLSIIFSAFLLLVSCSSLTIERVNFAWPLESVYSIDSTGVVEDLRYAVSFNIFSLVLEETGEKKINDDFQVRMIRGTKGYYYITAAGFKHVYQFYSSENEMILHNKILVEAKGIHSPAFNQRIPHIQLLYNGNKSVYLNENGIVEDNSGPK